MGLSNRDALEDLVVGYKICKDGQDEDLRLYYEMMDDLVIYKVEFYNGAWFRTSLDNPQRIFWNPDFKWMIYNGKTEEAPYNDKQA